MNTREALAQLGVTADTLTAEQRQLLDEQGYFIVPVLDLAIGRRDLPQQLNEREHLTPELAGRANPAQKFLLDIEGAEPKVMGYPPMPKEARLWTAAESVVRA